VLIESTIVVETHKRSSPVNSRWILRDYTPDSVFHRRRIRVVVTQELAQRFIETSHVDWRKPSGSDSVARSHPSTPASVRELFIVVVAELLDQCEAAVDQLVDPLRKYPC